MKSPSKANAVVEEKPAAQLTEGNESGQKRVPDIEAVRARFQNDRFAMENGMVIEEIGDHYARCSFEIHPCHLNAAGSVMGGAIFTLADFAFAVAANWNQGLRVSLSSQISYLGVARGTRLIAEARAVKEGRSTCYYLAEVRDDLGNIVAQVCTNGFVKG